MNVKTRKTRVIWSREVNQLMEKKQMDYRRWIHTDLFEWKQRGLTHMLMMMHCMALAWSCMHLDEHHRIQKNHRLLVYGTITSVEATK